MGIREIVTQIREGASDQQISRDMQLDRRTVKRYRKWAQEQGLLEGDIPEVEALQKLAASTLSDGMPPRKNNLVIPQSIFANMRNRISVTVTVQNNAC